MAPSTKNKEAILIIASSEQDANLYYATKFLAPDPFIFCQIGKKKILVASDLEIDRAKEQADVDDVLSRSCVEKILRSKNAAAPNTADVAGFLLKKYQINKITVPANFPISHADLLRKKGFRIAWKPNPFFEERTVKTREEIKAISEALRSTEQVFRQVADILRRSNIRGKFLIYKGKKLTSEYLKQCINTTLMSFHCINEHPIVSCAGDSTNPHHQGSGPLFANQSIIVDIFPYSSKTMYFADMTRTFVRGKASPLLKKMYAAVKEGQEIAFSKIRNGADGFKIHAAIVKRFHELGFETGAKNGRMQGFIHGTGHGVGLSIHEAPRISGAHDILKTNQVVTVEPGLYYRAIGGVRLEDMAVVGKNGCINLTKFPKFLEL